MRTQQYRGDYRLKIIALWTAFLLGMLFHTQLALMPLFHGLSVAHSHTHDYLPLNTLFGLMLGLFGIAMAAIVTTALVNGQGYKTLHFGLILLYTVINGSHLIFDVWVGVPSYQLCRMGYLLIMGLLLNVVAFQWFDSESNKQPVLRLVH